MVHSLSLLDSLLAGHGAVIFARGIVQLHPSPKPVSKLCLAEVAQGAHSGARLTVDHHTVAYSQVAIGRQARSG